jgi:hypothetical protein
LIANPNHVKAKLDISDLSAPREPTRKERCVLAYERTVDALLSS